MSGNRSHYQQVIDDFRTTTLDMDNYEDQDETNDYVDYRSGTEQDSDTTNEYARVNRIVLSKKSDEYRQRRERNNAAVKKSRFKSKQKTIETQRRVEQLKNENAQLERRLDSLSREFNLMRDIFVPRRDGRQSMKSDNKPSQVSCNIQTNYPANHQILQQVIVSDLGDIPVPSSSGQTLTSEINYVNSNPEL